MKKTLNLLMMLWLVALASCSADEPQTISATEDYNREFVKEFGVPAQGHDFSMATTAGLKVTSKNGDHITVTAEIDGEEYLFADCHVPAGTTAIPVTIPRTVSQLKLATTRGVTNVATNAMVDLDDITTTTTQRTVSMDDYYFPTLLFKQSDFLDKFFTSYPQSTSRMSDISLIELCFNNEGYIFPVYWRTNKNGNSDYKVKLVESWFTRNENVKETELIFSDKTDPTTPFPGLRFINENTTLEKAYQIWTAPGTAYPNDSYNSNAYIASTGIRIEDFLRKAEYEDMWYLELNYGADNNGNYSVSSLSPYRNIALWDGHYFDVPLRALTQAYTGACMYYPYYNDEFYVVDNRLKLGDNVESAASWGPLMKITSYSAVLFGFTSAPKTNASSEARDFCDAVFLFLPTDSHSAALMNTVPSYTWTIAAEDLGSTDDWDFNDAVFTFTDQIKDLNTARGRDAVVWGPRDAEPVRVISVTPKAAGGTMPLYITYTGKIAKVPEIPNGLGDTANMPYSIANSNLKRQMAAINWSDGTHIVGKEIHAWLGADSYKTMVNTGERQQNLKAQAVEFAIPVDTQLGVGYDAASGTFDDNTLMASAANKTLCGFAVLVDRNNTLNIDAMNDSEQGMHRADNLVMGQGMYVIGRPDAANGEIAPQMILVNNGYWRWPQERVKISEAYPDFPAWLANPASAPNWADKYVKDKVTF
ncbi:MAG: LruC domain-containing protein [Muribaculaceae bacterium]|nr:LruC domain-containing protein [Muribaculaceae bacterium]